MLVEEHFQLVVSHIVTKVLDVDIGELLGFGPQFSLPLLARLETTYEPERQRARESKRERERERAIAETFVKWSEKRRENQGPIVYSSQSNILRFPKPPGRILTTLR